jgi:hypothetical protein
MTFAPLVITVNDTETDDGETIQVASMGSGPSVPNGSILYGLQTPLLDMKPLELVLDLDYKALGPAHHFSARYDKLVILRPEELNNLGSGSGLGLTNRQSEDAFRQRFQVKPGDYPWYCYWNQTYIEGYIYSEDNSTAASITSFPTQWPTTSPTPISLDTVSIEVPSAEVITTTAEITTTITTTSSYSSLPTVIQSAEVVSPTPSLIPAVKRDSASDASSPPRMSPYPRIVKIEERRLSDSPQPYCKQMLLLDNGEITTAPIPNQIWLQETDPSYEEYFASDRSTTTGRKGKRLENQRRSDPPDACHCQWMFR